MKKTPFLKFKILVSALGLCSVGAQAAGITAGDLVIYRVGSGSSSLTSAATSVFLDEYTTGGALVQSIAMPTNITGGNKILTASGTATSEGELTISSNGQYLALTGYNAAVGTASVAGTASATTSRTVGIFNVATGNLDTSTSLTNFSTANNPRSAVTSNGSDIWVAGAAGGVAYTTKGATTDTQLSTTVTNIRQVNIFDGQLYASDSSGTTVRLGAVGAGLPTTGGQTITELPGISPSTGSPYSFFFAHLGTGTTGMDTLYVADDASGITKYSLEGAIWVATGKVGAATDTFRGLTGEVIGNTVDLFATGLGGSTATGGGKLVSFIDNSGYAGTFNATGTILASAASNEAFRGVALVPSVAAVPLPSTFWLLGSALLATLSLKRRNAQA